MWRSPFFELLSQEQLVALPSICCLWQACSHPSSHSTMLHVSWPLSAFRRAVQCETLLKTDPKAPIVCSAAGLGRLFWHGPAPSIPATGKQG